MAHLARQLHLQAEDRPSQRLPPFVSDGRWVVTVNLGDDLHLYADPETLVAYATHLLRIADDAVDALAEAAAEEAS